MSRLVALLATGAAALAIFPAAASARPHHHGFAGTYPFASALCARAEANRLPKKLAASSDQVKALCATLHSSFLTAQGNFRTAVAGIPSQAKADIAAARSTCLTAKQTHDRAACRAAIKQARLQLRALRLQVRGANVAYHAAVEAARKSFWSSIHALRGGSQVKGDQPSSAGPQSPVVPGDNSLPQS